MTWNNKGGGWNGLGPMIAMMAAQAASEWDDTKSRGKRGWGASHSDTDDEAAGGWQDNRRRSGSRRRGRMFATGELRLALLALIADEPRHGYELIRAIEDMTGGGYAPSPGAVYPTLQLLEDEGAIKPAKAKGSGSGNGEAGGKKPFRVTKSGAAELEERADEVEALMARLGEHGDRAERVRERSPDLFRAMGNLASVLRNKARAGKLDKDAVDQIVDIIDEVAKRIERM